MSGERDTETKRRIGKGEKANKGEKMRKRIKVTWRKAVGERDALRHKSYMYQALKACYCCTSLPVMFLY